MGRRRRRECSQGTIETFNTQVRTLFHLQARTLADADLGDFRIRTFIGRDNLEKIFNLSSPPSVLLSHPRPMPQRSKHKKNYGASAGSTTSAAPSRKKLTPEEYVQLCDAMREMLGGREPRDFQLEMVRAQEEGEDALCHAATGSGKTAIAAGPYALSKNVGRVTFMVSPLIGLQNEMVRSPVCCLSLIHAINRLKPSKTTSNSQP